MVVAVVGGNLQGVEATYLAQKAGWEVLVIDRKSAAPAKGFCDQFLQLDVVTEKNLANALKGVDLVIPALENDRALACLEALCQTESMPLAFDAAAYNVSSSKSRSNELFARLQVPLPLPWPDCGFPVLAKPDNASGSHGVSVFFDSERLRTQMNQASAGWVLQEYLQGPSYSIEIIGRPGRYHPLLVTDLQMDAAFDCKRVLAPTDLAPRWIAEFETIAIKLADALQLKGLMDVEVILAGNVLKVLEIDARLPSQTPAAVYWSSGVNMVEMLGDLFIEGSCAPPKYLSPCKSVVFEHIRVTPTLLEIAGEHIMSGVDPLQVQADFFGADEALTNYAPGRPEWVATLVVCENDRNSAWQKRNTVIAAIRRHFKIETYRDSSPNRSGDWK